MNNRLTIKGQVTIPKRVRDALQLEPGDGISFDVNASGEVVVQKAQKNAARKARKRDRFEAVRGKAQVKWRTDDLMALLRDK
jgi:antitoxin PrlF